jgi:hypothetical protein
MFDRFCKIFDVKFKDFDTELQGNHLAILERSSGAVTFMKEFQGQTFKEGLYRVHKASELDKWNHIVYEAFPFYSNKIFCFSYDWLGRHFALDFTRMSEGEPMILMLEPGTGEALAIPSTFLSFHEEELVEYPDAALANDFFNEWKKENSKPVDHSNCVGYKVPLFLGGEDEISNLEVSDMEVYWGIMGQLIKRIL